MGKKVCYRTWLKINQTRLARNKRNHTLFDITSQNSENREAYTLPNVIEEKQGKLSRFSHERNRPGNDLINELRESHDLWTLQKAKYLLKRINSPILMMNDGNRTQFVSVSEIIVLLALFHRVDYNCKPKY